MDNLLIKDLKSFNDSVVKNAMLTSGNLHKINTVMFSLEDGYINPIQVNYLQDALKEINSVIANLLDDTYALNSLTTELVTELRDE